MSCRLTPTFAGELLQAQDNQKQVIFVLEETMTVAALQSDMWGNTVEIEQKEKHTSLASRFVCPPFSVIDTKQGYWQERKALWKNLGIKSEAGRDVAAIVNTANVKYEYFSGRGDSDASIFDPVLCETLYTWFCPPDGSILDPFAGGSVRGIVAHMMGRQYTGVDLSERQVRANHEQSQRITPSDAPSWIVGNSEELPRLLGLSKAWCDSPGIFDFIFSCPPYYNLEQYSDDPNDLSNKPDYKCFLVSYRVIISKLAALLKPNRFACFVVGNVRNSGGAYHDLVGDTVRAFSDMGLGLYNEIVLLGSIGSLPIRVSAHFNTGRKVGKAHQNVLVFVKGDGMVAAKECEQL